MARRWLSFSIEEWDNLAWWVRHTYIEGMEEELTGESQQAPPAAGTPKREYGTDLSGVPVGATSAMGFTEFTVGPDGVQRVGRPRA